MAKISIVSAKYIVHASIDIEGVVDRPDVIGAIFGQTEGLLGEDLELRELQRSGRIGRIEVNVDTRSGKTRGEIIVPSSLDKSETAIIGAALEVIQRIGPCNAKITVTGIEDVRVSKRKFIISRAKELLKNLIDQVMPDSQELSDEVAYSVRVMEVRDYGKDRLPAGPHIDDSDEITIVEGRADVLNLLKHGFKNVISMNGTSVPETIIELSRKKITTIFIDGDRGGDLIVKSLLDCAEIDYIVKAPSGTEVEDLTKKELHKALRGRIAVEQAKMEISNGHTAPPARSAPPARATPAPARSAPRRAPPSRPRYEKKPSAPTLTSDQSKSFKEMQEDLIGTRGAYILDDKLNIMGKVPLTELSTTIKSLSTDVNAIVFDGVVDTDLLKTAERANVSFLVAMDSKVGSTPSKVRVLTAGSF